MGQLDEAIREHLELKRRHGADAEEIARMEREALGPVRRGPEPVQPGSVERSAPAPPVRTQGAPAWAAGVPETKAGAPEIHAARAGQPPAPPTPGEPSVRRLEREPSGHDVAQERPDVLPGMPESDRLWFEHKPPNDFDF
jgi:hypothetical protein